MKRSKILTGSRTVTITVLVILIGCTTTTPTPTPLEEAMIAIQTETATSIAMTPTQTSPPPTPTPTPSNTPTSSPTLQPKATQTPFAISTPLGESAAEQVLWLLETNNGCELPCWWGITPGQTDWPTAQKFLSIFDSNIYEAAVTSELTYYGIRIPLLPEIFRVDQTELGILAHDGFVEKIFTDVSFGNTPPGYLTSYTLSMFLTNYGQPSEVWLFTYRSAFEGNELPFAVVLFYADEGIVGLFSDNGGRQGDIVQGCPQKDVVSFLSLWEPSLDLTFAQVINGTSALERDYLALEDATEMDIEAFYETFKNADNTTCLETPASLWR